MSIAENIAKIAQELKPSGAKLIVVSKTQTPERIREAYDAGQRLFGENTVQELLDKRSSLPQDISWHFIGHLQSNKVKGIASFITLIQSVDSLSLLIEINKQALKNARVIDVLLQVAIADEETKFGLSFDEIVELLRSDNFTRLQNVRVCGLMGIATNTSFQRQVKEEFYELGTFFKGLKQSFFSSSDFFRELSIGMSDDYKLALEADSTMVRIGSGVFGRRKKLVHEN